MNLQQLQTQLQNAERAAVDTNRTQEERQLAAEDAQILAELIQAREAQAAEAPPRPQTGMAQEFMTGVLRPLQLPEQVTGPLGLAPPPETMGQAFLQGAGEAGGLLMAANPLLRGGAAVAASPQARSAMGRIGQSIRQQYQERPRRFLASELTAGGGAGAGMELGRGAAQQQGVDPTVPEAVGGLLGGGALGLATDAAGSLGRTGVSLTDRLFGALPRAERSLRNVAMSPEEAAGNIGMYQQDPLLSRLTPARLSDDPGLLAGEQRLLEANPQLRARVESERLAVQEELTQQGRTMFGNTRNPVEWERDVFQFGSAPGAEIQSSNTQDMLAQARQSFVPAYNAFRNEIVDENNLRTLGRDVKSAIDNPQFTAGKEARESVSDFINSQLRPIAQRFNANEALTTGDLIDVRTAVRAEQRRYAGRTDASSQDRLRALDEVENVLTGRIQESLGPSLADEMAIVDGQYRQYKVLEDAVFRSGEGSLDAQALSKAIAHSARSRGQFATGADAEFRSLALTGHPVERLLADPETARRAMRDRSNEEISVVKGTVANHIFDQATVPDGPNFTLSGERILRQLNSTDAQGVRFTDAMKRLGYTETDITRMRDIANRLVLVQRSPHRVAQDMIGDEASIMMRLAASLGAVQTARSVVDTLGFNTGVGQLVIAGRFSNATTRQLNNLTVGQKVKLLEAATVDGELYRALLLRGNARPQQVRDAEIALNAWLATVGASATERQVEEGVERVEGMFRQPDSTLTPGFEPPAPQGMMP